MFFFLFVMFRDTSRYKTFAIASFADGQNCADAIAKAGVVPQKIQGLRVCILKSRQVLGVFVHFWTKIWSANIWTNANDFTLVEGLNPIFSVC
jgi:hypothetical protein